MSLRFSSRTILAGAFALALSAAPAVLVVMPGPAAFVAECPPGLVADPASGACNEVAPHEGTEAIPGNPALPQVDGVPCTGANTGQCIGLEESQGGGAAPIP